MGTPPQADPRLAADRERVMRMVLSLAEMYGEALSEDRTAAYVEALIDVPLEHLRLGMQRHVRLSKFFPRPAELREATDREIDAQRPVTDIRAMQVDRVCVNCEDQGWVIVGERTDLAQPTARRCPCYQTNPKLVQRKASNYGAEDAR